MPPAPPPPHVVVVGGGIAGLAAAHALRRRGGDRLRVTICETAPTLGGKLAVSDVAGLPVDAGAEALLARRPEGVALARAVGLGPALVHPASGAAGVWSRGALRRLPAGQVMGVPADLPALARTRLLTTRELARLSLDVALPRTPLGADVSVASYVGARLGRAVVDRLVEPLLGGVYAGRADALSFAATVPQLSAAARERRSLLVAARHALSRTTSAAGTTPTATAPGSPVFASLVGGLGRLPAAVAAACRADVRTGTAVRELRRTPAGWHLVTGSAAGPVVIRADAVVLALPAHPAARLLRADVPAAAAELATLDYASVAILTLAWPRTALPALPGSGFLVPPVERRLVKGVTFSSAKWAWYGEVAPDVVVVRLSVGRAGEEGDLQRDDDDLTRAAAVELGAALGAEVGPPVDVRVTRWGGALPQYAVGHLARTARVRAAVAAQPGLAVCGAAYDGVGVPACVASGERAAEEIVRQLADVLRADRGGGEWTHAGQHGHLDCAHPTPSA